MSYSLWSTPSALGVHGVWALEPLANLRFQYTDLELKGQACMSQFQTSGASTSIWKKTGRGGQGA